MGTFTTAVKVYTEHEMDHYMKDRHNSIPGVRVCMCACVCMCVYFCVGAGVRVHLSVVCACVHTCVCMSVYACVSVCLSVCLCVRTPFPVWGEVTVGTSPLCHINECRASP